MAASAASTVSVSYDPIYDVSTTSLNKVACSDGPHGLKRFGFSTLGDLPKFPMIGGAQVIAGYGSESCGSCWELTYNTTSIRILAIDHTDTGLNIGLAAMNALTNDRAQFLGRIQATATQLDAAACGLRE
ncbi:cerato-platanin domain-containing protein [Purpureocillium lilacinum]|uniref:Cerato-platanin domain-containing protein n=1 Tax=Purpureocillium lilacinum TaxID=33203 RepID=A0A179HMW1_PURLI|nr:cerato-platanin domain-containing protein [Purpureocillium lilacinum]OAQ91657.1 cerato-platanin domain-containing protein [Purpureocillium lilacinum]